MSDAASGAGVDPWGPDPERARQLADDLETALGAEAAGRAAPEIRRLCAHAPFLAPMLRRHPEWLTGLCPGALDTPLDPEALAGRLAGACRAADPGGALRRVKYEALLRITLRELSPELAASEAVLGELSDLADGLLDAAFRVARDRVAERRGPARFADAEASFCVLGLGKLGARELNYSSDVDLIYLREDSAPGAETPGGDTPGEYFAALAQEFGALVSEVAGDGFLYRVDLDLRPEGGRGALVISESALAAYYESRADTWERAAFAKARPVAGNHELGWRAIRAVDPAVFRSSMDLATVRGIRRLKHDVVEERGGREGVFDVKRDPGGIRDVEFVAQALQLLHGGRIPQIRVRGTLDALEQLSRVGLLPAAEAAALAETYRFLRRLENRLQMRAERQVHAFPVDAQGLAFWASAMELSGEDFARVLDAHRDTARAAAEAIFPEDRAEAVLDLFARHQPRLLALPESRRMMEQLADDLSREIASSSDPELAFNNLDRFVEGIGGHRFYYELLLDRPELIPRLCALFASSRFLSNLLAQYPRLIEPVFDDPKRLLLASDQLREDLASLVAEHGAEADDFEAALRTLRLFVHRQTLNIGLLDLGGAVPRAQVEGALSDLAQVALERALAIAEGELARRRPEALGDARFLVVGMGKLASRELGYGSDLDLIFLYELSEPSPALIAEAQDFFVKLIQRLISALQTQTAEGRCYEIDARLRPSGSQGSLVCSHEAFARYHRGGSEAWERQALLRSRAVAGDAALAARFESTRREILSRDPDPDLAASIHHIRERMEQELAREVQGRRDFKTGRGGLLDVESCVQYLQLSHGVAHPALLAAHRVETQVAYLADHGLLAPERAAALAEGFDFLQRLSSALRIAENRSISDLDTERGDLDRLGRRMGYAPGVRERDVGKPASASLTGTKANISPLPTAKRPMDSMIELTARGGRVAFASAKLDPLL